MPPKGYKKRPYLMPAEPPLETPAPITLPDPEPIAVEPIVPPAPARQCKTCEAWVGCNDWGKCKFNPLPADKFATDWCLRHQMKTK
jgi:hypothetical protein